MENNEKKEKTRLQLDFTKETYELLEKMKIESECSSKVEVIRRSIRIYEWMLEQAKEKRFIEVVNAEGKQITRIEAKWFL